MKKLILVIGICFYVVLTYAQQDAYNLYEKKDYTTDNGHVLPYRILFPENYDKTKKYPLILLLHGSGARGKDNEKQLFERSENGEKQLRSSSSLFLKDENRKKYKVIVVVPQCPENSSWSIMRIDTIEQKATRVFDYNIEPTWPLLATNELVRKLIKEEAVDPSRVYITGWSMGGHGTYEFVYRNPDLFAAALPICGGGDVVKYDKRVSRTAFWIFHGDIDGVVDVKYSRDMVAKLQNLKSEIRYKEFPGVGHNAWDSAFAEPDFLTWTFSHKKTK